VFKVQASYGGMTQAVPSQKEWSKNNPYCGECDTALGDLNGDGGWNVLDIVALANCVLASTCGGIDDGCSADMNGDGNYNVLDIVALANCVLADNCGGL